MVTNEQVYFAVSLSILCHAFIYAAGIAFLEMKFRAREKRDKEREDRRRAARLDARLKHLEERG